MSKKKDPYEWHHKNYPSTAVKKIRVGYGIAYRGRQGIIRRPTNQYIKVTFDGRRVASYIHPTDPDIELRY